jgi:hypothetical protein
MANESKTPEEYLSDALDLMVKAKWITVAQRRLEAAKEDPSVPPEGDGASHRLKGPEAP